MNFSDNAALPASSGTLMPASAVVTIYRDLLVTRLQVPNLWNIFEYGCIGMIGGHIDGWSVEQENFGRIDDREVEEGDIADAEDDFDVRDLLLDETD